MKIINSKEDRIILCRILNRIIDPARRHRCEICKEVFECHLCTIDEDNHLHWRSVFICEECVISYDVKTLFVLDRVSTKKGKTSYNEYEALTGRLMKHYNKVYYHKNKRSHHKLGILGGLTKGCP